VITMEKYYSTLAASRVLGIARKSVPIVAAAAKVRVRKLPGLPVAYVREDIDRVAAESIGVAGADPQGSPGEGRPSRDS
jgi:hypothetical protein